MNTKFVKALLRTALVASTVALSSVAGAAITTVNLTAQRTATTLPDGAVVPMWGYCGAVGTNADASLAAGTVTPVTCGTGWSVGPTITVPGGSDLVINLTNNLPVPTSVVVLGQLGGGLGAPSRIVGLAAHAQQTTTTWPGNGGATFTPPAQLDRVMSMSSEVAANTTPPVTTTATTLPTWSKLKPGTYLYETGTLPSIQAPMGLYGVLIVTQAPVQADALNNVAFAAGKAYPSSLSCLANTTAVDPGCVAYDSDVALLFSEIDPVQNKAVDAAAAAGTDVKLRFDDATCTPNCYPAAVNYTPTYFLINGKSFDTAAPGNSAFQIPATASTGNVLVRFLNAGLRSHVPAIVGLPMSIVAEDGNLAPGKPKVQNEVLLTAGKTHDALVSPPSAATAYSAIAFPVFDRQLSLSAANQLSAGMQAFLQINGGALPTAQTPTKVTPTAVADMFPVPLNTSINGNVRTNDIAVANAAVVTQPTNGTLSFYSDGSFVYTPNTAFSGVDTFTYNGNNGTTNTVTVTLNIGDSAGSGTGTAPIAVSDSYSSKLATRYMASQPGVLANDTDAAGHVLGGLTAVLVDNGSCTSVALNANGSFTATGSGSCQFTYKAVNAQNVASITAATVTVSFPTASGLTVTVVDPATASAITDYRWIIQEDLTFKVDATGTPALATRTLGTSFHKSHMAVVASGCVGDNSCGSGQTVRGAIAGQQAPTLPGEVALDPTKNYYISILPGDAGAGGHAMGGTEIKPGQTSVTVNSNAYGYVPSQLSVFIYEDNAPVNNQNDLNETGLGGFNIILMDAVGRSGDVAGQQTYDAYGMPLSNWLLGRPGCPDDQNKNTNAPGNPNVSSVNGNVVGAVYTCPNDPNEGTPQADPAKYALAGHALIQNLTPARYDVIAHPAAERQGRGEVWWQVETLEGTPAQDAFNGVKEPRYFQEFGPPGFHTTIGFVNPDRVKKYAVDNNLTGNNTITGKITNQHMSRPSNVALWDSDSYDLLSSTTCQVALNSEGGDGPAIAITTCDRDGNFTLSGVPAGSYEIAIWDQWLDQIIQAVAVTVPEGGNKTVAMGNLPVLSWFTQYDQNIFMESSTKPINQRGIYRPDLGDTGISNVTMTTRYRDGGISNQTATDSSGNGLLAELFPLFNWYVTEADTTRFKQSGVNVIVDAGGKTDTSGLGTGLWNSVYQATAANPTGCTPAGYPTGSLGPACPAANSTSRVEIPGAYSYGLQGFISQRNTINWGRVPYAANENGGIQGVVVYSTTRPFDDQRYNVQTLWEPLVPRVTVNLYLKGKAADGTETLTLVDTTLTSSWDDYVNATDANGKQVNMQCPGQRPDDPFFMFTLAGNDQFRCYDGWHNWNQVQAAPYDGRYQFPSAAYIAAHSTQIPAGGTLVTLPAGQYVVEAVTPAGYQIVKEEDKNILNGDSFVAPAVTQFAGIGNVFILPDQATLNNDNPFNLKTADGIRNNATTNLGATASQLQFPECVGTMHRVPDYLSLFPGGGLVAPFAGMDRPLCDRKVVSLNDQQQASANFFVFTEVPAAAAGTGIILDDATSEFNAAAPDFGEKASVPFVPVSIKDFNGREVGRSISDQWGAYNVMTPSSWLVNPPTPSGYGPNMLVTCINDPGPIPDPSGAIDPVTLKVRMITDPQYNAGYSNFCYTLPFMPGRTTYLDTPVLPVAAFAAGYNPADCEYPDATPGIARVDAGSGANFGPYLTKVGGQLTITAIGDKKVPNPAYAGPFATTGPASQRTLTRHYGFGALQGPAKVTLNGATLSVATWDDAHIVVNVPANAVGGQLVVEAANGRASVDAVTVTIEDRAPKRVQASAGQTIQAAIDTATPGDLILVDAGTYNELVVMWKPVRLQGVGASSVIINAAKYPTSKLDVWRPTINALFGIDINTGNQATTGTQVDPLPGQEVTGGVVLLEPSVLGTEEGAGITVLAKGFRADGVTPLTNSNADCGQTNVGSYASTTVTLDLTNGANTVPTPGLSNFLCGASRIDGLSVTGGDAGGGIYVNGWAHNLEIANNRVYGNAGALNGGVRIGVPYLEQPFFPGVVENTDGTGTTGTPTLIGPNGNKFIAGFGYDNGVSIHHNAITKNGTVEGPAGNGGAGGGVSICTGTDGYSIDHNWICGNFSSADGGGIGHIGYSQSRYVGNTVIPNSITNNSILFNQSFQQTSSTHGGGIMVEGEPNILGSLTLGTGNLTIDANIIRGNFSEGGHGGGIRTQQVNGADVEAFASSNQWHKITMTNNMVVNNVAGWGGGGISMADTLNSSIVNNTVASNDSTGIAGVLLTGNVPAQIPAEGVSGTTGKGRPNPAGISSDPTSQDLRNARSTVAPISHPELTNNILWKNRSFYYDGTSGTATLCANNGTDTTCGHLADQSTTGMCDNTTARYWDLGVLGAASATAVTSATPAPYSASSSVQTTVGNVRTVTVSLAVDSNLGVGQQLTLAGFAPGTSGLTQAQINARYAGLFTITPIGADSFSFVANNGTGLLVTDVQFAMLDMSAASATPLPVNFTGTAQLNPTYSVLTSLVGYAGTGNSAADPMLADLYCNGSRVTPEFAGVINPPSVKNLQVAATTDEGNNYVNLRYGPLYLAKPTDGTGATVTAFGDYHLAGLTLNTAGNVTGSTSPAFHMGVAVSPAVNHDFDYDPRPTVPVTAGQVSGYDIGADQVAIQGPKMIVSPATTLDYGVVSINTFKALVVTVSNDASATANLVLAAPSVTAGTSGSSQPTKYSFTTTCVTGTPGMAPGTACTITTTFAPTAVTLPLVQTATLNVNTVNATNVAVNLTGTGVLPFYTITPGPLVGHGFGNQQVSTLSGPFQFTLTNTAASLGGELWLSGNPVLSGGNASQFQAAFGAGDTCTTTTHLATGATCTFSVVFAPTTAGNKGTSATSPGARVDVTHVAGAVNAGLTGSPVWGTGTAPSTTSVGSLTFGNQVLGTTSGSQTVTLSNPAGNPSMTGLSFTFTGNFHRATGGAAGSCSTGGGSLSGGSSCTVNVVFAPTGSAGTQVGTLAIGTSSAVAVPAAVNLTGTAVAPVAAVTQGTVAFLTSVNRGTNGATQIVMTVNNPAGNPSLTAMAYTLGGTDPTYWSRQTGAGSDCGTTIAANVTCNVRYRFNPPSTGSGGTAGAKSATVTLSSTLNGLTFSPISSVTLTGTAN